LMHSTSMHNKNIDVDDDSDEDDNVVEKNSMRAVA